MMAKIGLVAQQNSMTCVNSLNAELNLICHLLALLGAHHILHVSRIRVKLGTRYTIEYSSSSSCCCCCFCCCCCCGYRSFEL